MNANAVIRLMSLLSLWMWTGQGQTFQPQLSSFQASVTSNTVILKQPYCIFNQTCSGCVIWLVAALTSATGNFDAQVNVTFAPSVLNASPYPTAFNSPSTNFFVTQVGPLANFPCNQSPNDLYFIVGAEGKCSGSNCNGILPDGSIVSFKYLLIDPNNQTIVSLSNWSISIPLVQIQNPQNITVGLIARSGAMVVITTILCVAVGLLLLLFFIMLCVAYCCKKGTSHATSPRTVKSSFRIPRYDIHSLKGRKHPYDNQAFDPEVKKYSTSDTLPKSGIQTQKL